MLESGEADIVLRVTPDEAQRLASESSIKLKKTSTARAMFFAIDMTNPCLRRCPRFRQAINYAVDVRSIVDALFGSDTPVLDSPLAPNVFGYVSTKDYDYDPDKAKQLLQDAGYQPLAISRSRSGRPTAVTFKMQR